MYMCTYVPKGGGAYWRGGLIFSIYPKGGGAYWRFYGNLSSLITSIPCPLTGSLVVLPLAHVVLDDVGVDLVLWGQGGFVAGTLVMMMMML